MIPYILFASKKIKTIETTINTELKLVSRWLQHNRLSLNEGKTELIFFHSIHHKLDYDSISIKLNGIKLTRVTCVKYLGMYLDENLNWNEHVSQLSKKLSRANGILSKLRYNAPLNVLLQVYHSIFYTHLYYGCNLWGFTLKSNLDHIQVLQNKCLRILTFADFKSNVDHLYPKLGLLKVSEVIKLSQLKLSFESYHLYLLMTYQVHFPLSSSRR